MYGLNRENASITPVQERDVSRINAMGVESSRVDDSTVSRETESARRAVRHGIDAVAQAGTGGALAGLSPISIGRRTRGLRRAGRPVLDSRCVSLWSPARRTQ